MNVSFLVEYTGEETVRYWLQTKVKERQLHIRNGPGLIKAGMTAVDVGRKIFDLCLKWHDISFVQDWFCFLVLNEDFFLDMPCKQTCIIGSQTAPHRDPSCLPINVPIERESVQ